jgi:hypothetical protein
MFLAPDILAAITNGEVRVKRLTIAHPLGFFIGHFAMSQRGQ